MRLVASYNIFSRLFQHDLDDLLKNKVGDATTDGDF